MAEVSNVEIDGRIGRLILQRTEAENTCVLLAGQLAAKEADIAALKARVAELEKAAPG